MPRATPMRVSSPISRLRLAASDRARAVSARAAASRYPARTATSSWRDPTGGFTKPESSSDGISAGRSGSPSRPSATIAPPASTNARSTSTVKIERLSESSTKTVGRSSTTSSRGTRASRASIWALSSADRTPAGVQAGVCSRRYLTAWGWAPRRPGTSRHEFFTRWRPCCASVYSGKTASARWYISAAFSFWPRSWYKSALE